MRKKSQLSRKIEAVTTKTLVVGIDIAKEMQWARFVDCRGIECGKAMYFRNDRTGFEVILTKIRQISKGNAFADAIGRNRRNGTDRPLLEGIGELLDEAGACPSGTCQSVSHEKGKGTG